METNTITRIATVATKRGSVRIANNSNDVKCLVIDGFAPDDKVCFVPVNVVVGKLLGKSVKSLMLYNAIAKKLMDDANKNKPKGATKATIKECQDPALRLLLSKLGIKGSFVHHIAGEVFTKEDGTEGVYTKDWDELDCDTVTFSYGQYKEAYENCDPTPFINGGEDDVVEDFEF